MSKTTNRSTAPRDGGSVEHRLARLLDTPLLARVVPQLAPETLHQLIQYRGLDACGELVASATAAQLTSLLDLDLWHRAPHGRDEQFDVGRFGEWLEVLVETGESIAARTVAAIDSHIVIAGLSRYLRVFDPGVFEPTAASDDEAPDRHEMMNSEVTDGAPECDVGGYLVRARRKDAWDAILTLLVTLEAEHNHCFHAVMQGCRHLSHSKPEVDGLDDLLMAAEQHLHDVAIEREHRRARDGYASPADARAFLQLARQPRDTPRAPAAMNPIAASYFRAVEEEPDAIHERSSSGASDRVPHDVTTAADASSPGDNDISTWIGAVGELLAEAGHLRQGAPKRAPALLEAASETPRAARRTPLTRLMQFVRHADEAAYLARCREIAFVANTLLAGCSVQSRPFRPEEASDAAAAICNLGLECWAAGWPRATSPPARSAQAGGAASLPDAFLVDHDLVTVFEVGWSVLYRDVSLFVADQLMSTLATLHCADVDTRRGLHALRRTLAKQRAAGTPWLARNAADVLTMLDVTVWISVLGLLDECPILPAALTAVLERRTSSVSPTEFAFISTTAQLGDIRVFMSALPGVLSR